MSFSIIVPIYNAGQTLRRCVDSVLAQTVQNWELILVDDGSTDDSGLLADAYAEQDDRIRALHCPNRGALFARREGLACAEGEYILFLDADDRWKPECLAILAAAITEHFPDVILFTGQELSPTGQKVRLIGQYAPKKAWVCKEELYRAILSGHEYNAIWLKLFRRELFDGDDTDYTALQDVAAGEDKAQALFALTAARKVLFLPDVLYDYFRNPVGVTRSMQLARAPQYLAEPVFKLVYRYMQLWGMDEAENRQRIAVYYLRNFLSVYYGLRRQCHTLQSKREFRRFPWKKHFDFAALRYRFSPKLSRKEKFKLFAALWLMR